MNYANINTNQMNVPRTSLPNPLNATWNPTIDQYYENGWREQLSIDQPESGWAVTKYAIQELSSTTCKLIIAEQYNIAEEIERQRQAKLATLTPQLLMQAGAFRKILRTYFGENAETNHDVTFTAVMNYFLAKQASGTITAQEVADMTVLKEIYVILVAWTGDGTTWSFPWDYVPII